MYLITYLYIQVLYKGFVVPYLFAFFFWPILYGNPQSALGETSPSETKDPCGEHSREEGGSSTSCSADAIQQQLKVKDRLFKENLSIKKEISSLAEEEFQREKIAYPILRDLYSRTEVIEKICSEEFITNDEARRGISPEEGEEGTPSSSQLLRPHEEEFWKPCFRLIPVGRDLKLAIQD